MKPRPQFDRDIHPMLQKRWSPRAFSSRPVGEQERMALFEAARWAASSMNEQPWRFVYAMPEQPERYRSLFSCLSDNNQRWAGAAPLLILALVKTTFTHNDRPNPFALHDLGLAMGNLTLQASALDLYVHHMGGFSRTKVNAAFDLPPGLEPVTIIAVGYLGDPESLPADLRKRELAEQQRRSVEDTILNAPLAGAHVGRDDRPDGTKDGL